ncbi:hypothetical protein [Amycolatopsis sp. DSM 110486]|uniref:hypothetical protein n=1 Tax=Amycolatopsis sp. DSM 110486 TaxID=2865832 RepID=UPI001C6A8491|nr:hypothetical protein [Amycolatopsis sp. DSM 110486]QYN17554.1 hypothetical protein K1T34_32735 [Amycolatopsis sp. DSM 110486]
MAITRTENTDDADTVVTTIGLVTIHRTYHRNGTGSVHAYDNTPGTKSPYIAFKGLQRGAADRKFQQLAERAAHAK